MTGRSILYAVAVLAAFYLLGSFIMWDFNPGNWPVICRVLAGGIGSWFAVMTAIYARMEL